MALSSGHTVRSMVIMQAEPPTKLETGSAMKTPLTPSPKRPGRIRVRGTTMMTLRKMEKKMACFFLLRALKAVCPLICSAWKMKAKK